MLCNITSNLKYFTIENGCFELTCPDANTQGSLKEFYLVWTLKQHAQDDLW